MLLLPAGHSRPGRCRSRAAPTRLLHRNQRRDHRRRPRRCSHVRSWRPSPSPSFPGSRRRRGVRTRENPGWRRRGRFASTRAFARGGPRRRSRRGGRPSAGRPALCNRIRSGSAARPALGSPDHAPSCRSTGPSRPGSGLRGRSTGSLFPASGRRPPVNRLIPTGSSYSRPLDRPSLTRPASPALLPPASRPALPCPWPASSPRAPCEWTARSDPRPPRASAGTRPRAASRRTRGRTA